MKTILKVENLSMQFGGVLAVNNLNLEVNKGEIVSLIGPNGAGKTTAFNAITGVHELSNGCIYFNDELIMENHPTGKLKKNYKGENATLYKNKILKTPDMLVKLGMARTFQNIRLFKSMTVFENVLVGRHVRKKANYFESMFHLDQKEEDEDKRKVLELIELVGLSDVKDELASSLPYGTQRKVEICRALATNPTFLLLDEPAAGMNPQESDELTQFIKEIREKFDLTILLIEHHINLVMDISDRIYVINFGSLIACGKPAEIQNNKLVIDAYLGEDEDE